MAVDAKNNDNGIENFIMEIWLTLKQNMRAVSDLSRNNANGKVSREVVFHLLDWLMATEKERKRMIENLLQVMADVDVLNFGWMLQFSE